MQQSGRNRGCRSVWAIVGAAWGLWLTGCAPEDDWELTEIGVEQELAELEVEADEAAALELESAELAAEDEAAGVEQESAELEAEDEAAGVEPESAELEAAGVEQESAELEAEEAWQDEAFEVMPGAHGGGTTRAERGRRMGR